MTNITVMNESLKKREKEIALSRKVSSKNTISSVIQITCINHPRAKKEIIYTVYIRENVFSLCEIVCINQDLMIFDEILI